jgi:hypothetical protein
MKVAVKEMLESGELEEDGPSAPGGPPKLTQAAPDSRS